MEVAGRMSDKINVLRLYSYQLAISIGLFYLGFVSLIIALGFLFKRVYGLEFQLVFSICGLALLAYTSLFDRLVEN